MLICRRELFFFIIILSVEFGSQNKNKSLWQLLYTFHLKLHICIISITEYLWYNNSNLLGRHTRYVHNKKFALQSRLRRLVLVGTPSPRGAAYRAVGTTDARRAIGFFCGHFQENSLFNLACAVLPYQGLTESSRRCLQGRHNWS